MKKAYRVKVTRTHFPSQVVFTGDNNEMAEAAFKAACITCRLWSADPKEVIVHFEVSVESWETDKCWTPYFVCP